MNEEKKNVAEETIEFFENRINQSETYDKNKVIDLVNEAMESLKIPRGSYGRTKKILAKVMLEKGIITKGKGFEQKADGLKITFEGEKAPLPQPPAQTAPTENQPSFLGMVQDQDKKGQDSQQAPQTAQTQQQTKPQLPPLTEAQLPSYKRKTSKIISLGQRLYLKFGIITEEEKKQYEQEYKDLSEDMADYCIENNCRLPKQLELYLIVAQFGFLFVLPIFKWIFKPKKKDEKKSEKKDEKLS